MPKVQTSSSPSSSRPALRRNQACLSCRKRKLKCDAGRPHCTTCVKQWKALISVPPPLGYAHPTEPLCTYDPVDGLPLAPDAGPLDKIRALEEQINQLKNQLKESNASSSSNTGLSNSSPAISLVPSPELASDVIVLPDAPFLDNALTTIPPTSQLHDAISRPDMPLLSSRPSASPSNDILISGWNPDLPEPSVVNHLVETFFKCDPCASRIFHRPSFLACMQLPPTHDDFPHCALLHAICASASRWTSTGATVTHLGTRRDRFAEFHASKTRQYIDRTMASGRDIFQVMQACIVLSWYLYQEGRWVEVWIYAGFQTRIAVPLRLNYPGTFSVHANNGPEAYLPPPKDVLEQEIRRRTWWMTIVFDRIVSVGGWVHAVDERDIGTELPLRAVDFETQRPVSVNPQDISQDCIFVHHPSMYTDSFLLLIKAVMLFGRVTEYNVRTNLRAPVTATRTLNPFNLVGFKELDTLVCVDFLANIPASHKHCGLAEDGSFDTDLYLVNLIPHAAAITLHNPYLDFSDPHCVSANRCLHSARYILAAYHEICGTSLDISRMHPFVVICWYLAAVVKIQLCKYFIEVRDADREYAVWGQINVLRSAMLTYGEKSPIGTRQEKLLQGVLTEIVRMTTQMQPLEVGVPLYPFSRETAFNKHATDSIMAQGPPLPSSSPYDEELPSPLKTSMQIGHSIGGSQVGWNPILDQHAVLVPTLISNSIYP